MKDTSCVCRDNQLPFGRGPRSSINLTRNNDPVHAKACQFTDFASLKVQYGRLGQRNSSPANDAQVQVAFAF